MTMSARGRRAGYASLRSKLVRGMLLVAILSGVAIIGIVAVLNAKESSIHLAQVQAHIEEGIISKGRVLATDHALALRGLVIDNAFLDMQRLVDQAVQNDADLVYGVFVNSDRLTLAASRRGDSASHELPDKDVWRALGLQEHELLARELTLARTTRLGRDVLEV